MKGLSLFSSAGIGETYLHECNIDIIAANELLPRRAELHRKLFPNCNMICGDITDKSIYDSVIKAAQGIEFLIASPPCQGMSVAGKNRHTNTMLEDPRNYLVTYVFNAIEELKPKYILIENVPMLLKFCMPYKGRLHQIVDILQMKFGDEYEIEGRVVDAADYGVPQTRLRAIIKLYKKGECWP